MWQRWQFGGGPNASRRVQAVRESGPGVLYADLNRHWAPLQVDAITVA